MKNWIHNCKNQWGSKVTAVYEVMMSPAVCSHVEILETFVSRCCFLQPCSLFITHDSFFRQK